MIVKPKLIRITTVPQSLRGLLKDQMKYMKAQGFDVIAISSPGEVLKEVGENQNIKTYGLEMTRKISPIKDIKALIKLYKILKKEKPTIVHSHTPKAGVIAMVASKLARVPYRLHTVAGMPLLVATGVKRKILNFVEKLTYKSATNVYPNSEGLYKIILQNKFTKEAKLKVIAKGSSNGIDTSLFDPLNINEQVKINLKKELQIKPDDFIYIFVGRLVRDKGINELIEAFSKLNKENSKTKLLLVGSYERELDPLFPSTEKEINENKSIISVGYQMDVKPYFSISNVLTFPSYREGFPNVVMQAGAMGVNSIVTDINGCNEIIKEKYNGLIIPVKDSVSLYEKMKWLLENQNINTSMSNKTRNFICENYERKYVWQEILKEYNNILKTA